jgi:hypothetical protein
MVLVRGPSLDHLRNDEMHSTDGDAEDWHGFRRPSGRRDLVAELLRLCARPRICES